MANYKWDEFGTRYLIPEDGSAPIPAPEVGTGEALLVGAGKQLTDIGHGIQDFLGVLDPQEKQRAAQDQRLYSAFKKANPYASIAGEMLPTVATAPLSAGGVLSSMALQGGLGALEGYLDYNGGQTDRTGQAMAGFAGGVLGDIGGRMVGRVFNGARGLVRDIYGIRGQAGNPAAQAAEAAGYKTAAFQRMEQGTPAQLAAERASQGAAASGNPPAVLGEIMSFNKGKLGARAADAAGLPADTGVLDRAWRAQAVDRFSKEYDNVARLASTQGDMPLSENLARRLRNNRYVRDAIADGDLQGLVKPDNAPDDWVPTLTGAQWKEARELMADNTAKLWNDGVGTSAQRSQKVVDELDDFMEGHLGREFKDAYARLREQYRVFNLLERPNVINDSGVINEKTLQRALDSKSSGFGRSATAGQRVTNAETRKMIDDVEIINKPEFKPFKSSGTTENRAVAEDMREAAAAATSAVQGDVMPAMGFGARLLGNQVIGAAERGSGQVFESLYTPANQAIVRGGGVLGRSYLDEQLYPFFGVKDDRLR